MSLQVETRGLKAKGQVGRMTAVMRAATHTAVEKVLRVAIVHAGRIIEERVFRDPRRGFVDDQRLFERGRDGYFVVVPSGATGRIVTAEGIVEIGPHATRIRLDDTARGKIVLGKTTVLFQFVVPPPKNARPQLPLATQRAEIDWALTVIVAFSFLVHFGFIGSMFSDWLDPVVASDDTAIVRLLDMTPAPLSPVVEDAATNASQPSASVHIRDEGLQDRVASHTQPRQNSDAQAASLVRTAEAMQMSLLTAFTGTTAVSGALDRSEIPLPDLDGVARDARGAERASGDLRLATSLGVIPGATDLRGLGITRADPTRVAIERDPGGPKADITFTCQLPEGPTGTDIEGPIARLRPSFRSCYQRKGLAIDPTMQGKLTLDIHIAPNGEVADVTRVDGAGLSSAVEQCIIERVHIASFKAPGGTGVHARVPIIFRQQN